MKSLQTRFHLIALLAIVVVAAAISLPGLARASARSASAAPAHATVVIRDIAFRASSVTIARGGTVTWQWRDGDPALGSAVSHTVTSLGS